MSNSPHLNILVQLAKVDGEADPSELKLIKLIGLSKMISEDEIETVIKKAEATDPIPSVEDFSESEKMEILANLIRVIKADGIIHKEEMKYSMALVKKMGYSEDVIIEFIGNTTIGTDEDSEDDQLPMKIKAFLNK